MVRTTIALLALCLMPQAHAAEGRDGCTGTITSLPATVSTPGTWCLTGHLATAITQGAAITVASNDVSIDCNDFKIGGLAGFASTNAVGVSSTSRHGTTVRNCVIRGFIEGVRLDGSSSDGLVEDNRLDFNMVAAIVAEGSGHVIRRNRIFGAGGRPASVRTEGIRSTANFSRITDNTITHLRVAAADGDVVGILSLGNACEIARNSINTVTPSGTGSAAAIDTGSSSGGLLHRNQLLSPTAVTGTAILSGPDNQCGHNSYAGWSTGIVGCADAGSNFGN